jgi:hypothetical protein
VGRSVPLSSAVCTAEEQVIVQFPEVVERPLHIEDLSVTLFMLKLERLRLVKLLQPKNIAPMSVTLEVLKLERLRLVKPLQLLNILLIFTTFEVLKLETSRLVKLLQP